jgi:4'-phosphopantetheinyl transferase
MDAMTRVHVCFGESGAGVRAEDDALLGDEERARAARFARSTDAAHYVGAHANLRRSVAWRLGVDPVAVRIGRRACPGCGSTRHGPPGVMEPPGIGHVSLSRAGAHHAVAICDAAVGIDIERKRSLDTAQLAKSVFAPMEVELWRFVPQHLRNDVFLRWWVRKEAVAKALGLGLAVDVATVDVSNGRLPGGAGDLQVAQARAGGLGWTVLDLEAPDDGVLVSLAVRADDCTPQDIVRHRLPTPGTAPTSSGPNRGR